MYQPLYKYYRHLILIAVIGVGIYYANNNPVQPSSGVIDAIVISDDVVDHEVLPIPENFDDLISENKEIAAKKTEGNQELLAVQPHHRDEETPIINRHNSSTINSSINLLTGSDLWAYKPYLKEEIELEQQLSLPNDAGAMQVDDNLLNQLELGDSLILSLPNKGTQQIVIASIQREKNDVTIWGLQNSQRQDIGKITQIREIKEGSFITDDKQEYHLRTIKNKGWIASKNQLIDNNNQAITKNKQPFSEQFLSAK